MTFNPIDLVHKIQYINDVCLEIGLHPKDIYLRERLLDHGITPGTGSSENKIEKVFLSLPRVDNHVISFCSSVYESKFGRTFKINPTFDTFTFEPTAYLEKKIPEYITYNAGAKLSMFVHEIVPYELFQDEAWFFQQQCVWTESEFRHKLFMSYMYHLNVRSCKSDSMSVQLIYDKLQEALCRS